VVFGVDFKQSRDVNRPGNRGRNQPVSPRISLELDAKLSVYDQPDSIFHLCKRTESPAPGRRPLALSGRLTGAGYEAAALPRCLPYRSTKQAHSKIAFAVAQAQ
jgi:hypothetical protein